MNHGEEGQAEMGCGDFRVPVQLQGLLTHRDSLALPLPPLVSEFTSSLPAGHRAGHSPVL